MKKINIAIDGPGGSGKGTTAKQVAEKLDYIYLDTGALYRGVTLALDRKGIAPEDVEENSFEEISLSFKDNNLYLNDENVEEEIRGPRINVLVAPYCVIPILRKFVQGYQDEIKENKGVVMEGRDIGSEIMPDAELKIYLDCDITVRVERRLKQFLEKGEEKTLGEVINDIKERDHIDSTRDISPLTKADNAVVVDTTHHTIESQVDEIYQMALNIINN